MIDLHNHILPGVDDGAADITEALEIARQCASEGIVTVVATPHFDPGRERGAECEIVVQTIALVRAAIAAAEIDLNVVQGQEVYLTPAVISSLERGAVCTLGANGTILVELPFDLRPAYLDDLIFQIQLAGFPLIVAHPERYRYIQRDPLSIRLLVERGVALQLTAPSLLGDYGSRVKQTAEKLLQEGLYAIAASDRHHPGGSRSLATMRDHIADLTDDATAETLVRENPQRVLNGRPCILPTRSEPSRGGLFYRFRHHW